MTDRVQQHRHTYLDVLRELHARISPRSYLEIGCRFGDSLFLSDCPAIAVDPANRLRFPLRPNDLYFEMTSDEFFARHSVADLLENPVDLAFIDGMHLAEFALRDFINVEKSLPATGVVVIDDVLPATLALATRQQRPGAWTGDVYKVVRILKQFRPDLQIDVFSVPVKGLAVIRNLDPTSTVLRDNYTAIDNGILSGRWAVSNIEALRIELAPHNTSEVAGVFASSR